MTSLFLLALAFALADWNVRNPGAAGSAVQGESTASTESRALSYLAREVPRWARENKCHSCHNNGDAARALYAAIRLSYPVPDGTIDETSRWLAQPEQWDHNGGEGPFSDKKLARIQFAAALVEGLNTGWIKDRKALTRAAELVAGHQSPDGSWQVEAPGTLGSPATYGTCLATCQARRVLEMVDAVRYRKAIAKAEQWLRGVALHSVLDAAAILLASDPSTRPEMPSRQVECLALIRKGQSASGGWGPYVYSSTEPFDTALVLLALCRAKGDMPRRSTKEQMEIESMIRRGRAYLVATQKPDGSWPETTRPPGAESYAQRVSTTGWATLALLATRR